jgi:hypothetical protein
VTSSIWSQLADRAAEEPVRLAGTVVFACAIVHTFLAGRLHAWAGALARSRPGASRVLHILGEVEVVFAIWCVPLFLLLASRIGWSHAVHYFGREVSYDEAIFVVVIMTIAATRPVLRVAERGLRAVAVLMGGGPAAWWLTILTLAPILGSLITEPAAMTLAALLLSRRFYDAGPSPRAAYATLGLLFVNVSVGGVFTHFAAPPVLMVAKPWGWTTPFMLRHFGWIALAGIVAGNALYFLALRRSFASLRPPEAAEGGGPSGRPVPAWITAVHLVFLAAAVACAHAPVVLLAGMLLFGLFHEATKEHQSTLALRSPLLVGVFLAGLVVHGGLQRWWLEPVLSRLTELPMLLGAAVLTAFNDNAAVTYLATLVPSLSDPVKHAVVAGAVAGGGLTVIANAPNPAGQAILGRHFPDGIAPSGLLLGALPATAIMLACFVLAR